MKRWIAPAILLLLAALLIGPLLWGPGKRDGEGEPLAPPAVGAGDYVWANKVDPPQPPIEAFGPRVMGDPVERAVSRLRWGTPDIRHWTQKHLPEETDRLRRRLIAVLRDLGAHGSLDTPPLLETLGVLGGEESVPILLEYARQGPDYQQIPALMALSHCPITAEAEEVLIELSSHPNPQVRGAATRAIVLQPGFMDHSTMSAFLQEHEGHEVHLALDQVGTMGLTELADDAARHLAGPIDTRQIAIRSLLRLGDPRGLLAATEELQHPIAGRVILALTVFRDVGQIPPLEEAWRLVDHEDPDVRKQLAVALGGVADERQADSVRSMLQALAESQDPVIQAAAVKQLARGGRTETLHRYRERLRTATGEQLMETVRYLCEALRDPESASILRDRLARGLRSPVDVAHVLFGLRFVGEPSDADAFIEPMLRGGTLDDRRGEGHGNYLSEFASLYVQTLGPAVLEPLVDALERAPNDRARALVLDAIRGVLNQRHPRLEQMLFDWLADDDASLAIRLASADTLFFQQDAAVGPRLLEAAETCGHPLVAQRLLRLFACYF